MWSIRSSTCGCRGRSSSIRGRIRIRPPSNRRADEPTYKVDELEVNARLVDQVAQVQVSQSFENTGSRPLEVSFIFPLPYEGAVHQLTLLIDGKEYPARLLDAKEARQRYEDIVRKNRDPALLEWMGTGMFQTSVFPVPPGGKRTVTLRYSQLCRQQNGLTDFLFPLSTAKYTSQPVERVSLRVSIDSQKAIKNVYSPTHAVDIHRPDERHAVVTYTCKNEVPAADFRLLYDVGRGTLSARVLSYRPDRGEDGYFLLLASPEIKAPDRERQKKTVMFVIDRSGSMSGKKIEQVQAALKCVLNDLHEGDLFNIIAYDSEVESFRPELQRFDDKTRRAALGFVEGIYAGGSTNIDGALRTALGQLQDRTGPRYIIFLTDGIPTVGETNEQKIIADGHGGEQGPRPDLRLRRRLRRQRPLPRQAGPRAARPDRIRPSQRGHRGARGQPLQAHPVAGAHRPAVGIRLRRNPQRAGKTGQSRLSQGLLRPVRRRAVGRGRPLQEGGGGQGDRQRLGRPTGQQKFDFPANFTEKSPDDSNAFIEKLWAVRRVGEILDELDLQGKNEELVKELVELSKRHGILTPYTSFMADENTNLYDVAGNASIADRRLANMERVSGGRRRGQRAYKGQLQNAVQAPAAARADALRSFSAEEAKDKFGGDGSGGGQGGFYGPTAAKSADTAKKENTAAEQSVRNVGNRTFFRRDGQWVDSRLTKDQQAKAQRSSSSARSISTWPNATAAPCRSTWSSTNLCC